LILKNRQQNPNLLFIHPREKPTDQAREPPSQLELHSLEHSYIGLELEGGGHLLGFWICQEFAWKFLVIYPILYLFLYYSYYSSATMTMTLLCSAILDMTLLYLFIFSIIMFVVYFDYMLGIAGLDLYSNIGSYSARSFNSWVSGKYCVGVVPIPYFFVIAPYIPDRLVVHGTDSPIGSYIVHLPNVDRVEHNYYKERLAMFVIFLHNISMV
jgi:hypothetical protein